MRIWLLVALSTAACWSQGPGFEPLFDGSTLKGWNLRPGEAASGQWTVEGSALTVSGRPGNLETTDEFEDFDLRLQWKVAKLGNSGVFYRAPQNGNPALSSVEYQIADNSRQASQAYPVRRAGAAYGLYPPSADVTRPVGEWNSLRILARGTKVEHWLNGSKVVEFDVASRDFARRAETAKKSREFARARKGRIVLQDHNSAVWFRNLRIRHLD